MGQEMSRVRDELVMVKREKEKLEKPKAIVGKLKRSTGGAERLAVTSVPEGKYCKLEADYDNALQEIKVCCLLHGVSKFLCSSYEHLLQALRRQLEDHLNHYKEQQVVRTDVQATSESSTVSYDLNTSLFTICS